MSEFTRRAEEMRDKRLAQDRAISDVVIIPNILINRLQGLGPHFCLVAARDKNPNIGGPDWQKPEKLMFADNPRLRDHLRRGGNYGVVGGFGLVIVDADSEELKRLIKEKLPRTFTVESPGHIGWHLYYLCSLEKPIRLRDKNKENVGDIQGQGKMVVGPGSIHPNGCVYRIIDDSPLAQVTREQLIEAFKDWVVPDQEIERAETAARMEKRETKIDLNILDVIPLSGMRKQGDEYYGPHPIHGSETGRNFWINPNKNCWHCFRHSTGGGPLLWFAVQEGLIVCEEAVAGALKGDIFKKVLRKAEEKGLIEPKKPAEKDLPKETEQQPVSPEIMEKARELVKSPAFFYELGKIIEKGFEVKKIKKKRFILEEERNKRLLPILIASSPIVRVIGEIGTAKDTMVRMGLHLLERGLKTVERTHITPGVLKYSPHLKEADILYIPDTPVLQGEQGRQLRFMRADDGGIVAEYVTRQEGSMEFTTLVSELPIKGVVTTSNEIQIDRALESGSWTLITSESEELTRKVKLEKLKSWAKKHEYATEENIQLFQEAFRILLKEQQAEEEINIPYAEALIDLLDNPRSESRRDPDKLCSLIEIVAKCRRFQKPQELWGQADLADLYIALQIGWDAIIQTLSPLTPEEQEIINLILEESDQKITSKKLAKKIKKAQTTAYRKLERLTDKGYLAKEKVKKLNEYEVLTEIYSRFARNQTCLSPIEEIERVLRPISIYASLHEDTTLIDPITGEKIVLRPKEDRIEVYKVREGRLEPVLSLSEDYPDAKMQDAETGIKQGGINQKTPKESLITR